MGDSYYMIKAKYIHQNTYESKVWNDCKPLDRSELENYSINLIPSRFIEEQ